MAQNIVEYLRSQPDLKQAKREQRRGEILAREKAQTVVDHPGWQLYLDHLEAIRGDLKERITSQEDKLVNGTITKASAVQGMVIQLREIKAQLKGIDLAIEIIPEIIRRGEEASRSLES